MESKPETHTKVLKLSRVVSKWVVAVFVVAVFIVVVVVVLIVVNLVSGENGDSLIQFRSSNPDSVESRLGCLPPPQ